MFPANGYNVMIVSPSDVVQEREICKNAIYEWNAIHSERHGIYLNPIGWDINAYPEMGTHPQNVLNRQILDRADVLICVLWTRIGTPTTEYASGSVEEISKHVASGKPVLLYFSSAPVVLDSVDQSQYEKLKEYKKSIHGSSFYKQYDSVSQFSKMLRSDLQLLVNDHLTGLPTSASSFPQESSEVAGIRNTLSQLSDDAKILLKEASEDRGGNIVRMNMMDGLHVQTNGKELKADRDDARRASEIEEGIELLENYGLIKDAGYKREVFKITAEGYRIAEKIGYDE